MSTKYLLPYSFKKAGMIMIPTGLILWLAGQFGMSYKLTALFRNEILPENFSLNTLPNIYYCTNIILLTVSFFAFIAGIYFMVFSKEKIEDEYIATTRLHSFQIAALIQLCFFIISFLFMFVTNTEPSHDAGLAVFFLLAIFIFWLFYIIHFNYVLYKNRKLST